MVRDVLSSKVDRALYPRALTWEALRCRNRPVESKSGGFYNKENPSEEVGGALRVKTRAFGVYIHAYIYIHIHTYIYIYVYMKGSGGLGFGFFIARLQR